MKRKSINNMNYPKLLFIALCIVLMITSTINISSSGAMLSQPSTGTEEVPVTGESSALEGEIDDAYKQEIMKQIQLLK